MLQEFFHIIRKLNPQQNEVINIKTKILDINLAWNEWIKECLRPSQECEAPIHEIYKNARSLDYEINFALKEKISFKEAQTDTDIEMTLALLTELNELSNRSYEFLHHLEELMITLNTSFYFDNTFQKKLAPLLHNMLFTSEMLLVSQVDAQYRPVFDFIWENFFKEVEKDMIIEKNQKILMNDLEDLNIAWNTFHMRTTKSNLDFDQNLAKIITIMHNRWNSILKIILGTWKLSKKKWRIPAIPIN